MARALAGLPRVLLLDEPASGLRAAERHELAELIGELRRDGTTILLVEHDVGLVTSLAQRITVLDLGRVIADGSPAEVTADPAVVKAYLGTGATACCTSVTSSSATARRSPSTACPWRSARGEMVALVGPNGAGKSTLINTVSGLLAPASGSVVVDGRVAQVPEGRQMFPDMSVEDNLRPRAAGRSATGTSARCSTCCPDLAGMRRRKAGRLSGGQQQMVAIGRALMARPDLLAIDELSLGLAPLVVAELADHLRYLNPSAAPPSSWSSRRSRLAFDVCAARLRAGGGPGRSCPVRAPSSRESDAVRKAYFGDLAVAATDRNPKRRSLR